jgi:methionyl-tRNA formyltransferase
MKVLFLGPRDSSIYKLLRKTDTVKRTSQPVTRAMTKGMDWLVSHRYTRRVPGKILELFPKNNINIHLGLSGHVRGVHPVFWSALMDKLFGYTMHRMVQQFDAGPIYICNLADIYYPQQQTFRSLWDNLERQAANSFQINWPQLKTGEMHPELRSICGHYYSKREFDETKWVMDKGWDTLITTAKERYENRNRGE